MALPKMTRIQQRFEAPVLTDLPAAIHTELERINASAIIKSGETVAVTAGSRGVANVATAVKATVDYLKSLGAHPFVVPAMGSHGGATAEGQRSVLEHYGITEETVGGARESDNGSRGTRKDSRRLACFSGSVCR